MTPGAQAAGAAESKHVSQNAKDGEHNDVVDEEKNAEDDDDDDQGYDEVGKPGEWTEPKNRGGSVWLTSAKPMCRVVNTDGFFMDLDPDTLTKAQVYSLLGTTSVISNAAKWCKRGRYYTRGISATKPNPKAAQCVLADVRGPCIFWEANVARRVLAFA